MVNFGIGHFSQTLQHGAYNYKYDYPARLLKLKESQSPRLAQEG